MRKKVMVLIVGILLAVALVTWAAINWLSAGVGGGCSA